MTTSAPDAVGPVDVLIRTTGDRARRASLARAIESVLGQQGVEARAIVVVVGKQPNVESAVAPRSGVKVHLSGCSAAPGRALRIAVDLVEAPYFAFLDDDDELLPHAMATRLAVMHADPAVTVVVTSGNWITQGRSEPHIPDITRHQGDLLNGIVERCWLASCGGLYRRTAVAPACFEGLPDLCEWTCLAFRLAADRVNVRFVDVPTYNVYDTPGSQSKSGAYMQATLQVLDMMRAASLPDPARARIERRYRAALHAAAEHFLRAKDLRKAWRYHLRSMKPPDTLRYGAYTRKLLWRSVPAPARRGEPTGGIR